MGLFTKEAKPVAPATKFKYFDAPTGQQESKPQKAAIKKMTIKKVIKKSVAKKKKK